MAPLLKRTDAVLAHAGWGTLIACIEGGVPMGALVLGADHEYNASILERAGCGFGLQPQSLTPELVAESTRRLLTVIPYLLTGRETVRPSVGPKYGESPDARGISDGVAGDHGQHPT